MPRSYPIKSAAEPIIHLIYTMLLSALGLSSNHFKHLTKRGLSGEQIHKAGYATKTGNTTKSVITALGRIIGEFPGKLDNVAGFFKDENDHWTLAKTIGLMIPVRDINGKIVSLLIRRDAETGPKYVAFSSAGKPSGNKVRQTTHCPNITGPAKEVAGTKIRITEGILKADIATALGNDMHCLGMHGLNLQADLPHILEVLETDTLYTALDAGEDDNVDMLRAKASLIKLCMDAGYDYVVETWDPKYGKGIDDVLMNGHADKIRHLSEDEVGLLLSDAYGINPNNGEWLYIVAIERFINIKTGQILKKAQFADKFRLGSTDEVNTLISEGFRQVDGITYLPDGADFVFEDKQRKFNEWRDPEIIPVKGNVEPFVNHIKYLFPEVEEQNVVLDWFAYTVQYPGKKLMWMLVIIGPQGVGKSFLAAPIVGLFGKDNVNLPTNEQLHEKYTDWQKKCQVVVIEELMAVGRKDLMNRLKPVITQDVTQIREMHTPTYPYPNRFNLIGFTNHKDSLLLDGDDRRYCVLNSDARPKDSAYYDELWKWIDDPRNIQSLKHFLLERDMSKFNPHARPPMTQAKEDMIKMSRSALEEWICNSIADYAWPFNRQIVCTPHLKARDVCPNGFEKMSDFKWAKAYEKAGADRYPGQITLSDKRRATVWLIGDKRNILMKLSPQELALRYEQEQLEADKKAREIVNPIQDSEPM